MKVVPVDEDFEIRYVAMKVTDEDSFYSGIKLLGPEGETIYYYVWNSAGRWTDEQEIPAGTQIVGLKCDTSD